MSSIGVYGSLNPVLVADLEANEGISYIMKKGGTTKGRWCLKAAEHDVTACTYLHRRADKAKNFVFVRGEPAPVAVTHLQQNRGLVAAMQNPREFGRWCSQPAPHDVTACKGLHLGTVPDAEDQFVKMRGEDTEQRVSYLLLNRCVQSLLDHPENEGVFCNNKTIHDVLTCRYVHRRVDEHPEVCNVDGEKFPVARADLVDNAAFRYLVENPQSCGRWCGLNVNHDASACNYLHRKNPYVRVDGLSVRITDLVSNRGLKHVIEHPEHEGHWCTGQHNEEHPMETCNYIHSKDGHKHGKPVGGHSDARRGGSDSRGGRGSNSDSRGGRGGSRAAPAPEMVAAAPAAPTRDRRNVRGPVADPAVVAATVSAASPAQPAPGSQATVRIGGDVYLVADLVRNRGLTYVVAHPGCSGKWCTRSNESHDPTRCSYLHHLRGNDGRSNDEAAAALTAAAKAALTPQKKVNVDGSTVSAAELVLNRGLEFLLTHDEATGKWCARSSSAGHDDTRCKYIHRK